MTKAKCGMIRSRTDTQSPHPIRVQTIVILKDGRMKARQESVEPSGLGQLSRGRMPHEHDVHCNRAQDLGWQAHYHF